jgi:hypothetical protein
MGLARLRFTVRRLMIAVALSPIVIFSGMAASEIWGTERNVVANLNSGQVLELSSEITTPWPAAIGMVTSTVMLGMAWIAIDRWRNRTIVPDPPEPK